MIGIYKITSPSGNIYIGQSIDVDYRLLRYKRMTTGSGQTKLWRSLNKYGAEKHVYEVVIECDVSKLNELERYYQEYFDCVKNGLNCRYTKTNDKSGRMSEDSRINNSIAQKEYWRLNKHLREPRKQSDESKLKISKANTGRKYSKEVNLSKGRKGRVSNMKGVIGVDNPLSKKIIQYSLDGGVIREWDSAMNVKRELGFSNSSISSCCSGRLKTANGFKWSFK
jgi:group I intron endonuclease